MEAVSNSIFPSRFIETPHILQSPPPSLIRAAFRRDGFLKINENLKPQRCSKFGKETMVSISGKRVRAVTHEISDGGEDEGTSGNGFGLIPGEEDWFDVRFSIKNGSFFPFPFFSFLGLLYAYSSFDGYPFLYLLILTSACDSGVYLMLYAFDDSSQGRNHTNYCCFMILTNITNIRYCCLLLVHLYVVGPICCYISSFHVEKMWIMLNLWKKNKRKKEKMDPWL